ncbi:MAG: DUF4097 family beta strand repeat-containing protein [Candidatus Eiseniibacteriota bacterium]
MIGTLAALTVAVLATGTQTDTTLAVKPGTRLELSNFGGMIAVSTWSKNALRVQAEHSSRTVVEIEASGPSLEVRAHHRRNIPTSVDYRLTVPTWMALELSGVNTDISVENSAGEVKVETVHGEISVIGGSKSVVANSVEGEVRIQRASGRIECGSVNGSVHVEGTTGPVIASSVNGEILMDRVDSDDVEATTVNGTVNYVGAVKNEGSYRFSTHNGDVTVTVPEGADATVSVATFSGDFSSSFPIPFKETKRGHRFTFTLGNGSARIELESFQGEIRLRRPGDPARAAGSKYEYKYKTGHAGTKSKHKNSGQEGDEP